MRTDLNSPPHARVDALLQWLRDTPKADAESRCATYGTSVGYLRQIAYGYKQAGLNGADIERITEGAVTRRHLRPDDCERIWPELAHPPAQPAAAQEGA